MMRTCALGVGPVLFALLGSGCGENAATAVAPEPHRELPAAEAFNSTSPHFTPPTTVSFSELGLQDIGSPSGLTLEPRGRGTFPHGIDGTFRYRVDHATHVVRMNDVSDVIAATLTIAEGGSAGWHSHPGAAIGIVAQGTFGVIEGHDCVLRTYGPGEAFFHPGRYLRAFSHPRQEHVDVGYNAGTGDVVVHLMFLGVPAGQPPTIFNLENPGCP